MRGKRRERERNTPVLCDPQAFEQVFSNLFHNSLSHALPGVKPLIQVGCAESGGTGAAFIITLPQGGSEKAGGR
ncbi:MAG: hypothetical protein RDV48_29080 [Candidatus Eremiobacteraeota bacterium]|nr:hypothetical protein [Candidatus Eremiobacteraeota bacterium]